MYTLYITYNIPDGSCELLMVERILALVAYLDVEAPLSSTTSSSLRWFLDRGEQVLFLRDISFQMTLDHNQIRPIVQMYSKSIKFGV